MPFFRPKPIEAIQVTDHATAAAWCGGYIKHGIAPAKPTDPPNVRDLVELGVCLSDMPPDSIRFARIGDWIIRRGDRFEILTNDQFQAVYESANPNQPST